MTSNPSGISSQEPNPFQLPVLQMEDITQQLAAQVTRQLPRILHRLIEDGFNPDHPLHLECSLTAGGTASPNADSRLPIALVNIGKDLNPMSEAASPHDSGSGHRGDFASATSRPIATNLEQNTISKHRQRAASDPRTQWSGDDDARPTKRMKETGKFHAAAKESRVDATSTDLVQNDDLELSKKRTPNPALQPSTFEKFVNGIWDSIFSGVRMNPTEVIEQWQAIESSGQPKLLMETNSGIANRDDTGAFGRMSVLTRKISQTSRTCRSLEVIVQTHWVQCFDDRVAELGKSRAREKAKKMAVSEACVDFDWTEKELRNKMAIWRGYLDIKNAGGWVALVFAGTGLYRLCKYRVSFTNETFQTLRHLRHRFEVAADTIHPRWRVLLGIVGESSDRKYTGHPHDWVVNGPGDEAIPLPQTYTQWDTNFSYIHLDSSVIDEESWWDFDPRTVTSETDPSTQKCQNCGEIQSDSPPQNNCCCYPNLYGSAKATMPPLQLFRTPDGKNNGLVACCQFEKGWAVGEFVGLITTGLEGLDVMVDRTERAGYQIWQGKQGNHTRFVNHSCEPNSQYERFIWLGKQRTVLVSKGIEAGEEVTVDYGHTYWQDLDKQCLCNKPGCRYQSRADKQLLTPPDDDDE